LKPKTSYGGDYTEFLIAQAIEECGEEYEENDEEVFEL
jgi:hypothetical protein